MKTFCSIVQSYYPRDRRIIKQVAAMVSKGYDVTVICLKHSDEPVRETIDGVAVHRINLGRERGSKIRYAFEYLSFFLLSFMKLNQLGRKRVFDVIQVSNLPDFLVLVTFIQKIRGAKILLDMHEITPEFYMSKYKKDDNNIIISVLKLIEKLCLNYANQVSTVSDTIAQVFNQRSIPGKEIAVVMNTIDESVAKQFHREDNGFNLVYHGYLDSMYGLDVAIEAMREFAQSNNVFKFYIFGAGPQRSYLEALVKKYGLNKQVFLMGRVPHGEMMDCLSRMTVGILPIRKDVFTDLSFSNKLGEYIYLNIPVIISNLETTRYYFSDKELTFFTSEDPMSLKEQIAFAYNNPDIMRERAQKAYRTYDAINWTVMKERYLDCIQSLCNKKG